jgi:uncharacterized protein YbjT (DUF2867 family)
MNETTLVLGGTGKTGRRVVERLSARGPAVRIGSRKGEPPFDWQDPAIWEPALRNVRAAYLAYYPDMAAPGAAETIGAFSDLAVRNGVRRLVLLSGRGEEERLPTERAVRESGAEWTILLSSWFCQNFSEGFLLPPVLAGQVVLPAGDVAEPFVDADDIADVAVAALTEDGHASQIYELTGRRLLTFAEAVAEAAGREIGYESVSTTRFATLLAEQAVSSADVAFLTELFTKVLDGRNAYVGDGVRRALGRPARDFAEYARDAANTGVWST